MTSENRQRLRYVAGDFLATNLAWFVFNIIRYFQIVIPAGLPVPSLGDYYSIPPVILGQIFFPIVMMGIYFMSGYYNRPFFKSRIDELLTTFYTASIGSIVIFFLAVVDDPIPDKASNFELLGMLFGLLFGFVYAVRLTITRFGFKQIHRGKWIQPIVIIGLTSGARRLRHRMESYHGRGYKTVAYIDPSTAGGNAPSRDTFDGLPVRSLAEMPALKEEYRLTAVIFPEKHSQTEESGFSGLLNRLYPLEIPILITPTSLQLVSTKPKLADIAAEPFIDICSANMSESSRNMKRAGDIVISALALICLLPAFAVIALLVKRDSRGPVFYLQERIGFHKKPFRIIKFRTMVRDAENDGPRLATEGDTRITPVGQFLRKYRLDELPQFWNVLRGDMSLVGPRPEREFFIRQILEKAPYSTLLHQVRPGITSWGMVKHGYASTVDAMIERSRYDLIYLENISLLVDLKILLHTVNTVLTGRGI